MTNASDKVDPIVNIYPTGSVTNVREVSIGDVWSAVFPLLAVGIPVVWISRQLVKANDALFAIHSLHQAWRYRGETSATASMLCYAVIFVVLFIVLRLLPVCSRHQRAQTAVSWWIRIAAFWVISMHLFGMVDKLFPSAARDSAFLGVLLGVFFTVLIGLTALSQPYFPKVQRIFLFLIAVVIAAELSAIPVLAGLAICSVKFASTFAGPMLKVAGCRIDAEADRGLLQHSLQFFTSIPFARLPHEHQSRLTAGGHEDIAQLAKNDTHEVFFFGQFSKIRQSVEHLLNLIKHHAAVWTLKYSSEDTVHPVGEYFALSLGDYIFFAQLVGLAARESMSCGCVSMGVIILGIVLSFLPQLRGYTWLPEAAIPLFSGMATYVSWSMVK